MPTEEARTTVEHQSPDIIIAEPSLLANIPQLVILHSVAGDKLELFLGAISQSGVSQELSSCLATGAIAWTYDDLCNPGTTNS